MTECKPRCYIDGEPWWDWHYEYDFEGKTYGFQVCARSADEAAARLKKIALARFCGQGDGGPIPLYRGWWIPLIVWWRNAVARR